MRSFFKTNWKNLAAVALTAFALTACGPTNNPDDPNGKKPGPVPTPPKDQTVNKLHEDPYKAEFILQECHTHGPTTWHGNATAEGAKYFNTSQKITYVLDKEKGWGPAQDSPTSFKVRHANGYHTPLETQPHPGVFYSLIIKYYNVEGKEITDQFLTNGQEKIHQHFFIPKENSIKSWTKDGTGSAITNFPKGENRVVDVVDYFYMDTDPWNKSFGEKQAKLIDANDPRGFKGIMRFNDLSDAPEVESKYYEFDLEVALMHSLTSKTDPEKTLSKTSTPSPFNAPSKAQRSVDMWDLNTTIHFIVYASTGEYLEDDFYDDDDNERPGKWEEIKDADDQDFVLRFAKAWNCTEDEALVDLFYITWGDRGHVDSGI